VLAAQAQAQAAHIRAASLTPRLVKFKHIKDIEIVGVPRGAIVNLQNENGADSAPSAQTATAPAPPAAPQPDTSGQDSGGQ